MLLNTNSRLERQKQVQFAVVIAAIDGGKPTLFTQNLLEQYENDPVTASQLKKASIQKYVKASN